MSIRPLIVVLSMGLYFSPILAVADQTQPCKAMQQANCQRFCQAHQGSKSCIVDITKRSGTCTCVDGTTHSK